MLYVLIPIANIYYYAQRYTPPDQTIKMQKTESETEATGAVRNLLGSHNIKQNKNNSKKMPPPKKTYAPNKKEIFQKKQKQKTSSSVPFIMNKQPPQVK